MKTLHTLKHYVRQAPRSMKALLTVAVITATASSAVVLAGWTPGRPVLDWNNTDDRQGSLDGPRINNFINTPYYGDERAFFDARFSDSTGENERAHFDVLEDVTTNETKQVVLRTYVHNGANQDFNDGISMAEDAQVRITLPSGTANALRARSYVSISNPAPGYPAEVTDTTELIDAGQKFSIDYVPGSATLYNAVHENGIALSDSIVTSGASIGYEKMNGQLPGCFEFQAVIEITVEVSVPELDLEKSVRASGAEDYGKFASVNPGETTEWLVRVQNTGDNTIDDVKVWDKLPPHVEVVPESVRWIYRDTDGTDRDVVQSDNDLFENYVDFGNWNPNGGFFLRYDTVALDNFDSCEVTVRNIAYAVGAQIDQQADYADIEIVKDPCGEPEQPEIQALRCNALEVSSLGDGTYSFTTLFSATGGAEQNGFVYDFGDGSNDLVTSDATVERTFDEGSYVVRSSVRGVVDGEAVTETSDACVQTVSFDSEDPEDPLEPELPEQLPVTGPASVIGLFTATTFLSAAAHRFVTGRRQF